MQAKYLMIFIGFANFVFLVTRLENRHSNDRKKRYYLVKVCYI